MQNLVSKTFRFEGNNVLFRKGNYTMVSATEMSKPFGKQVKDWLKTQSAKESIEALSKVKKILFLDLAIVLNGDLFPELYALASKSFESIYNQLMESWGNFAMRAQLSIKKR